MQFIKFMAIFTCMTMLLPFKLKYKFREETEFKKYLKMAFLKIFIPNVFENKLDRFFEWVLNIP